MAKQTITLKTVLHEINQPGHEFGLKFRTLSGDTSIKRRVKKNPGKASTPAGSGEKKDLHSIKRNMTRAGALLLYDVEKRHPFEVKIELMVEYNGDRIFHNY
ncbi:hypothetical protein GCM10027347_17660 [Larkinella harenae]